MTADSNKDLQYLKAIGRICAEALRRMQGAARVGMTTRELDEIGRAFLEAEGARSAPQAMYKFPGATCISVSPVIAHGIPNERLLREGELIHIDVSAELDGYFADTGASMVVSKSERRLEKLIEATRSSLNKALRAAKAGNRLNAISRAVQTEAGKRGYNVITDLTGHGIGRKLHEEPKEILNFYDSNDRRILNEGLVLAIEPFLTTGVGRVTQERDGWSLRTTDKAIAAQFEHTIVVTKNEPIILTL
ncbi:MAG: type I methionyl aminopeptidase [Anaerolineae bacterium]|nr:MAG: type I methionyl aminopeptidase [Anaerolineae bacterium]WKZ44139.1 MAG: type I methionyl aminopeptidase [Anaerolineales bacterium]